MASTNNRDVPLTLSVTTVGTESIKKLQGEVLALAKEGGAAAPEFQRLAEEIAKLGDQSKIIDTTRELSAEIDRLAVVENKASDTSVELRNSLYSLSAATGKLTESEAAAKTALIAGQNALFDKRQALATLKNETSASEKETSTYTASIKELNRQIIAGKSEVRELGEAYRAAKAATKEAASEEASMATSLAASTKELSQARAQLEARNQALAQSKAALQEAGGAAESLAASEVKLLNAYMASVASMDKVTAAHEAVIASARRAAAEEERLALIQQSNRKALEAQARAEADGLLRDYARMEQAQRDNAAAAAAAAKSIGDAFRTVGVKSAEELRAEIVRVREAMDTLEQKAGLTGNELKSAFATGDGRIKQLELELRAVNNELTLADKAANLFKGSLSQIAAGNIVADAVGYLVQRVTDMGRAFITVNVQLESLRRGLIAVYGDVGVASQQIGFLRKTAQEAGISVSGISDSFLRFAASAKASNIPLEQTNAVFAGLVRAAGTLGLSADKTSNALEALSQIASKGTVSLEELRGQLSEALPGALSLTAQGLGVTDAELIKMVSSGTLAARDMIPALTKSLKQFGGEVDGLLPTWQRFTGALTTIGQGVGAAGVIQLLTGALKLLGGTLTTIALGFSVLIEGVTSVGKAMLLFYGILSGDGKVAWAYFKDELDQSRVRLTEQADALNVMLNGTEAVAEGVTSLAGAQSRATASASGLSGVLQAQAVATQLAGDTSLDAAAKLQRLNLEIEKQLAANKASVEASTKRAKAVKEEGDSTLELTRLLGNQNRETETASTVANANAEALLKVVAAQRDETNLLQLQYDATVQSLQARGISATQIATETEKLAAKLTVSKAETEQAASAAAAAEREAFARGLAVEALQNHADKLEVYRGALARANELVKEYAAQALAGLNVEEKLAAARTSATQLQFLFNDALADSIKQREQDGNLRKLNLELSIAEASTAEQHTQALIREALAKGNTAKATQLTIEAKKQELSLLKLKLQLAELENKLAEENILQRLREIDATEAGSLVKIKELEIEKKRLEIRNLNNQAMRDAVKETERELDALKRGLVTRTGSTSAVSKDTTERIANTRATEGQTSALERQQAVVGAIQSKPIQSNRDKVSAENPYGLTNDGLKANADGSATGTYTAIGGTAQLDALMAKYQAGTLGGGDLAAAQAAYKTVKDGADFIRSMLSTNPGSVSSEATQSSNAALRNAQFILDAANAASGAAGATKQDNTPRTVNVNIGGVSTAVNVVSQADSDAIVSLMRQIETAANRSA
ncbi:tail length tape measure protein [Curvibacter phage PCA1]|nr:tail length tape measure protein [Curvibacter phage PCA1]